MQPLTREFSDKTEETKSLERNRPAAFKHEEDYLSDKHSLHVTTTAQFDTDQLSQKDLFQSDFSEVK